MDGWMDGMDVGMRFERNVHAGVERLRAKASAAIAPRELQLCTKSQFGEIRWGAKGLVGSEHSGVCYCCVELVACPIGCTRLGESTPGRQLKG